MSFVSGWIIGPIVVISMLGVLTRWRGWSEARWAASGAIALVLTLQVSPARALHGFWSGHDVYLFLAGMMFMADLARRTGLFDWLAVCAVNRAAGSSRRLFTGIYGVGIVVTVFLSNDATAVVLTPAVIAATRAARVSNPLPHLYACALVANAASFVLPISNPANLVVFADGLPDLAHWLSVFALPSCAAILLTYLALFLHQKRYLKARYSGTSLPLPTLTPAARVTAAGITVLVLALLGASALSWPLGGPACVAALLTALWVSRKDKGLATETLRGLSWSFVPLVGGLFILIEGLHAAGVTHVLAQGFNTLLQHSTLAAVWFSGVATGLVSNAVNNLPAGLFAGAMLVSADAPMAVRAATLIGINLGPNLSVTGSLATLLWLVALRREGMNVGAVQFLKMGAFTLPLALLASLALVALRH